MSHGPARCDGGVVILAAGRGRRFGSDKRMHLLPDGRPMLARSIELYAGAFARTIVVLRPDDPDPAPPNPSATAAHGATGHAPQIVHAADADLGMGHSLAAGVRAATGWDYVFVALADMPWVQPETLTRLRAALEQALAAGRRSVIVQPLYAGAPGHPVGFAGRHLPELARLGHDEGARSVLQRHADQVERLAVDDPGVLRDLDTPDQA